MDDLSTLQGFVLLASPALAAVAAAASWFGVFQTGKLAQQAIEPDLSIQLTDDRSTRTIGAVIHNGGGGPARGTCFLLGGRVHRCGDYVGHGVLAPGDTFKVDTAIPSDEDVKGIVSCRDRRGNAYAWTNDEDRYRERHDRRFRKNPRYQSLTDKFAEAYPNRPLDGLTTVSSVARPH